MKHIAIVITGNVQGVFFRASARNMADQLNIKGFAQNQPDGSVLIEVEGDDGPLEQFVEWCRHGPPRAQVASVEVQQKEVMNFTTFEIRR
jgi:acylphosphatase